MIKDLKDLSNIQERGLEKLLPGKPRIAVGMGTCGIGNGAGELYKVFKQEIKKKKLNAVLTQAGCFGFCSQEPLVNIYLPDKPLIILHKITPKDIPGIVKSLKKAVMPEKNVLCKIDSWDHLTKIINYGDDFAQIKTWNEIPFFKAQKKIVLRNCGLIDPEDIEEYIAIGGHQSLYKVLHSFSPEEVIIEIKKSKLRGRGGAGFPTGIKWELMRSTSAPKKYIICNADEGDPGAYMNRNEIESDPHSLLEGMLIGAYAMGAEEGIIYVRAEYPLAVKRLKIAIAQAEDYGLLGKNIFRSGFNFKINIVEGAGAFVCGEETALIASIEGQPGRPRPRPPFPAENGLWNHPTNINNVETWYNIPVIINNGGEWFAKTGSENSSGTKVFSLVGKIQNTGLVELPLGSTLETIIFDIGGSGIISKKIKAVQTGGPSGGCIPKELFKTPVDYEALTNLGAIMGSGGMVVMNEDNCMVDVARYFVEFTTSESCGKCVPCREGLYQALETLNAITKAKADESKLEALEKLGKIIKDTALCGLGQTGPNPVLTTLRYFQDEYLQHIKEGRCDAGICQTLFSSPCENSCPLHMNIPGFIQLLKEKKLTEAFMCVIQDNPLPAATGRVCHHPCELRCRRMEIDEPIAKREIHRYIADTIYKQKKDKKIIQRLKAEKLSFTGKKIAIVGSGPAGLTAAFYLVRLGHDVTIYEEQTHPGGMMHLTIPEYRMPKSILKHEIDNILSLGVKCIFKTKVGVDIGLKKLEKMHDAVFLSIGAQEEITLDIPGRTLNGVLPRIHFLRHPDEYRTYCKGKRLVVVGGGNVAIDTARTALRLGSEVIVVYRRQREDMLANPEEVQEAHDEGIKFIFLSAPLGIIGSAEGNVQGVEFKKMVLGGYDSSGRRKPVPTDETYVLSCDTVMLAIGDRVDSGFIKKEEIKVNDDHTLEVDKFTLKTNNPKIYAGGDVVSGPATVTEAMAAGKKFAKIIDQNLMGQKRFFKLFTKYNYKDTVPLAPEGKRRNEMRRLSIEKIRNNFKEVYLGLSSGQAGREVLRCLRCDIKTTP